MFVMFVILVFIAVCVGVLFWVFFKHVKLDNSTARKIEICGYGILLVLIIWEFGIKNIVMADFYNSDIWMIKEKLDIIFLGVQRLSGEAATNDLNSLYSDIGSNHSYVDNQMLFIDIAEFIMQILSTVFIAIGRFQELVNKEK